MESFIGMDKFGKKKSSSSMDACNAPQKDGRAWCAANEGLECSLLDEVGMEDGDGALWARVLAFKYCGGRGLPHPQAPTPSTPMPRHSNTWKRLVEHLRLVNENVGIEMGGRMCRAILAQ